MKQKQLLLTISIFIVALVCLVGIFYLIQKQTGLFTKLIPTPTPEQETPTMMLSFIPNTLTVSNGGEITANIQFDTLGNPATGVSVVVAYNPSQVTNVALAPVKDPTSALSYALNTVAGTTTFNPTKGVISENLIIPKSIPSPRGRGIIARFTGTLKQGVTSTTIRIDQSSSATSSTIKHVVLGKVNLDINQ